MSHSTCIRCGVELVSAARGRPRKYCSTDCAHAYHREMNPEMVRAWTAKSKANKAARWRASLPRDCAFCAVHFTARQSNQMYCTILCRNRAFSRMRREDGRAADQSAMRRARERGVSIRPGHRAAVLERDAFTCQICLLPIDVDVAYPAPLAAVVDHVVALAREGEHGPDNWQAAHHFCNSKKRELSMSEVHAKYPDLAETVLSLSRNGR